MARTDARRWVTRTTTTVLPAEIERDRMRMLHIAARMAGSDKDAPIWEAITGEVLASWLPAYEHHLREKCEAGDDYDRIWWQALERADWRCQRCGKLRPLSVHHRKHRSLRPDLKEDLDNLEAVCADCHNREHRK